MLKLCLFSPLLFGVDRKTTAKPPALLKMKFGTDSGLSLVTDPSGKNFRKGSWFLSAQSGYLRKSIL